MFTGFTNWRVSLVIAGLLATLLVVATGEQTNAQAANDAPWLPSDWPGDVDCSRSLNIKDAFDVAGLVVGLHEPGGPCPVNDGTMNAAAADVNGDGVINILDARVVAECVVGLRDERCQPRPEARFNTRAPGSELPSGEICAAVVRPVPENVAENAAWNARTGTTVAGTTYLSEGIAAGVLEARIDGNFTGTTDEIIQWAACKWGFDEDHVRAQVMLESSWFAGKLGDCGQATATTFGCESVGLYQVRGAERLGGVRAVHPGTMPWAWDSAAFNLDYALAVHRACFEGLEPWLAFASPNGVQYVAGDLTGCSGRWFSGDWYGDNANSYIASLESAIATNAWIAGATGCPNWQERTFCRPG